MSTYYYVYLLTNPTHTVFYIGVTSNLIRRVWQHKEKEIKGFTSNYHIDKLVWYEVHDDINEAIAKEKRLKGGSRVNKINLIETNNPRWKDLYEDIV